MTDLDLLKQCYDKLSIIYDANVPLVMALKNRLEQLEPPCKTGSQCLGGKCQRCAEPEPVAEVHTFIGSDFAAVRVTGDIKLEQPLYTAPPRKEWVGLTEDEISTLRAIFIETPKEFRDRPYGWAIAFARAVEAKLKEKNNANG